MVSGIDFAKALGWPLGTFYNARNSGKLPSPDELTPGGQQRWLPATATAFLRTQTPPKDPPASWNAKR